MELRDLVVTPFVIILVYTVGFFLRPLLTDDINRVYFFPALTLKIFGALAVGFIYQFYYAGGDTFNYHTYGSRHIWDAFMDSPLDGVRLLFASDHEIPPQGTYKYASQIVFFSDPSSYFVVRIAALFDLFTFSSYSATAVLFAVVSFFGMWLFFLTFYEQYPELHKWIATAAFFIPSVFFWGSGLLKDTITLSCLGITTYTIKNLFIDKRFRIYHVILFLISFYVIFSVKKYILLCYLPAVILWIGAGNLYLVRSVVLRTLLIPFVLVITAVAGYYAVVKIGEDDRRYSIDKIAVTARITAYDIGFYTGRDAGSGYSLGELDGTFSGMIKLAPQAVNVSLFRPYLWEVRNPLMLLSALESLGLFIFTVYVIFRRRGYFFRTLSYPDIIFCLVFSITFAFAIGVSTFNFGTLTRYKIPLIPFYFLALTLMMHYSNKDKNEEVTEATE